VPHLHAGLLHLRYNEYTTMDINRAMGALGKKANDKKVSLGMASPIETDRLEGMEGRSRVSSTRKNNNSSHRRMDQGASSNTRMAI
jgi:hypothetical protein